eukprot:4485221-Heterocapsa_arctica.AAC.1
MEPAPVERLRPQQRPEQRNIRFNGGTISEKLWALPSDPRLDTTCETRDRLSLSGQYRTLRRTRSAPAAFDSSPSEEQASAAGEPCLGRRDDISNLAESHTPTERVASRSRSPVLASEDPRARQLR